MADVAAQALLVMQANAPPGQLAAELEACSDFQTVVHSFGHELVDLTPDRNGVTAEVTVGGGMTGHSPK